MRRGLVLLICGAIVAVATTSANAQYYYPPAPNYYAPAPAYYNPAPYGAPAQYMPYGAGAYPMMQPRPMYYYPPPQQQMMRPPAPPPQYAGTNYAPRTYGPLLDVPPTPDPRSNPPATLPASRPAGKVPAKTTSNAKLYKSVSKQDAPPEMIGGACADGSCGPNACGPQGCGPDGCCGLEPFMAQHPHPRGHFVGQVGALFLVPYTDSTTAFVTTPAGGTPVPTEFARQVLYGERVSAAYICHNGWGIRAGYTHLGGTVTAAATNSDPLATITTPLGVALSPSASLLAGTAVDNLTFTQRLDLYYIDVEVLKECNWKSTTFLFGAGARYARMFQSYEATSAASGAVVPGSAASTSAQSSSRFEGVGPTASFEVVQPLTCWGLAVYGGTRGSWLWGTQRFTNSSSTTTTGVDGNGNVTNTITGVNDTSYSNQVATVVDAELGLQQGFRIGRCYVFGRAGAVYQRWWNVGSSTASGGNLAFLGGTAMLGITY